MIIKIYDIKLKIKTCYSIYILNLLVLEQKVKKRGMGSLENKPKIRKERISQKYMY